MPQPTTAPTRPPRMPTMTPSARKIAWMSRSREAQGLQDRDVPGLLVHHGRDDVVDAERRHQQDGADDRVHDRVLDHEQAQHVAVGLLPALGAVADPALDPARQRLGLGDVGQADADLVDDVAAVLEHLHGLEQSIALPVVDRADPALQEAGDLHRQRHSGRRHRGNGVAERGAETLGHAHADDQGIGGRAQVLERARRPCPARRWSPAVPARARCRRARSARRACRSAGSPGPAASGPPPRPGIASISAILARALRMPRGSAFGFTPLTATAPSA